MHLQGSARSEHPPKVYLEIYQEKISQIAPAGLPRHPNAAEVQLKFFPFSMGEELVVASHHRSKLCLDLGGGGAINIFQIWVGVIFAPVKMRRQSSCGMS